MRSLARILALTAALTSLPLLSGLTVKVKQLDPRKGKVILLLPMHSTMIEAQVLSQGDPIRLERNQFYESKFLSDHKRGDHNLLRIKIPREKPARFRIRKIHFIVR